MKSCEIEYIPKCIIIIPVFSQTARQITTFSNEICDSLSPCGCQIMDEADRLLEQGCTDFTKDLETIMSILPAKRQTLLFSATLTDTLQELKSIAMNQPFFWESKSE